MEAMTLDGQGLLSQTSIIISELSYLVEGVCLLIMDWKVSCGPSRMEYNGVSRSAFFEGVYAQSTVIILSFQYYSFLCG